MLLGGGNALRNYEADGVPEERCVEVRNVPLEIWNVPLGLVGEIQPGRDQKQDLNGRRWLRLISW